MKCPGQDTQYWTDGAIYEVNCPECGAQVEFYKDDTTRKCPKCSKRFVNPKMDFGCAAYCQFAEQCIGSLPEEFVGSQDNLLKDKVAVEVKRYCKSDFQKIGRISRVARYAEDIAKAEGGNIPVILCAAYLRELEREQSAEILGKLNAKEEIIDSVISLLKTISNGSASETQDAVLLQDAISVGAFEETHKKAQQDSTPAEPLDIEHIQTASGRKLAEIIVAKYA